jgi:protein TonB
MIIGFGLNTTGVKAKNQNASQQRKKEFPKDIKDTVQTKDFQDNVFCYVTEQMPQYPGGEVELMNYIAKNLKYPESAIQNKIQGKVIIRFLITEKGEIEKVEVVRPLYPACDQEAVRIVKSLSKFTPGKQNGKNTKVWYTIPIIFKLLK